MSPASVLLLKFLKTWIAKLVDMTPYLNFFFDQIVINYLIRRDDFQASLALSKKDSRKIWQGKEEEFKKSELTDAL